MATVVNAYRSVSTPDVVDGVINVSVDAAVAEPIVLVYQNLPKIYSDLAITGTGFQLVYIIYQKVSKPTPLATVYSFTARFGSKSGNVANPFTGPAGPAGTPGATGAAGPVGPTGAGGNGAGTTFTLESAESIVLLEAVSVDSTGKAQKADWNILSRTLCVGFAIGISGPVITIQKDGKITGFSGLSTGSTYYLSGSGTITNTPPVSKAVCQAIGVALSPTDLLISVNQFAIYGV